MKSRKRKAKPMSSPGVDYRAQHDEVVTLETIAAGVTVRKVVTECVVDRYHERMQINDRQHEAGLRLRKLWRAAVLEPSVVGGYGEPSGSGDGGLGVIQARDRLRTVMMGADLAREIDTGATPIETLAGDVWFPNLRFTVGKPGSVALAVCGLDEWAGGTRRLVLLREALTGLANYWKLDH